MKTIKPTQMWAITSGSVILEWTISTLRRDAIEAVRQNSRRDWKDLRKQGHRVVCVNVIPLNP